MKPFRWNIKKKEQLGGLLDIKAEKPRYPDKLADCAAKMVARSSNGKIVFVGRSPESIFDYLSGVFDGTSYEDKMDILNISNSFREIDDIRKKLPSAYVALKVHFVELGISPEQVLAEPNGICFTDLVDSGGTFEQLFDFIQQWALEDKQNFPALLGKLSFLGLTYRTENSPNTWRWQQNADWVKQHSKLTVKNVSLPPELWRYLGNYQLKVADTNKPERWGSADIMLPPREKDNLRALKQAYQRYTLGLEQKLAFAERLAATHEFREPWLRSLVNELKKNA